MDTKGEKSASQPKPQQGGEPHPDEYANDLAPDRMKGQNAGPGRGDMEVPLTTAYDVKDVHRALKGFTDDELKQIPILAAGTRLEQGGTYVDLADSARDEIRPTGGISAQTGHYWVPKDRVPYTLWNRLIGEQKFNQ